MFLDADLVVGLFKFTAGFHLLFLSWGPGWSLFLFANSAISSSKKSSDISLSEEGYDPYFGVWAQGDSVFWGVVCLVGVFCCLDDGLVSVFLCFCF